MCVTKRQSEEEKWPSKRKHVKSAAKMKSRLGVVPSVSSCYINLLWHVRVSDRFYIHYY
jgi:hypothetical protein